MTPQKEKFLDSDESEDEDHDYLQNQKGGEGLTDIENPNCVAQTTKKVTQLYLEEPKKLSNREHEEIKKQKSKEHSMKISLTDKTEQVNTDLDQLDPLLSGACSSSSNRNHSGGW